MEYEPLKLRINRILNRMPLFRRPFYLLLDALLLRQWYVKRAIRRISQSRESIRFYDAGAGFGQYSDYILSRKAGAEVLAVDINSELLDSLRNYYAGRDSLSLDTREGDLQSFIPEKRQDLIIAIDILEHIEDDLSVLQNFRAALSDDGRLIISTPYKSREADFTSEHFRNGYTEEELRTKLEQSGFEIERLDYSYGFWGNIAWHLIIKIPLTALKCPLCALLMVIYLPLVYPLALIFMLADYLGRNRTGKGLIIIARRHDPDR